MKKFLLRCLKKVGLYQEVIKTEYLVPSKTFKQGDRIIVKYALGESKAGSVVGDVVYGDSGIPGLATYIQEQVPIQFDDGKCEVKPVYMVYHAPLLKVL